MSLDITTVMVLLAFVGGFFVGGKWKARVMKKAIELELSATAKIKAIKKHL